MAKKNRNTELVNNVNITALTGDQVIIGVSGGLVKDKEYTVSADVAMVLISKGFATLKQ